MNKLPKDKRARIVLVGLATVLTGAALWVALIGPLLDKAAAVNRQIEDSRSKVELGSKSLASSNQVAAGLRTASEQLARAETNMGSGDLYAWMIQTMNRFKTPYAVDIPQISREVPAEVGSFPGFPYKAAIFVVRGTGFYHDFGKFLADFENTFPYIRVQNLELDAMGGPRMEDSEKLQFKIELVALVRQMAP